MNKYFVISSLPSSVVSVVVFLLIVSCGAREEVLFEFEFKCKSDKEIYFNKIIGFKKEIISGSLSKKREGGAVVSNIKVPNECMIEWYFVGKEKAVKPFITKIDLSKFRDQKIDGLKFIFNASDEWEVEAIRR